MFVQLTLNADHKDLIHDVAYDFYGKRLATCSSDQTVKVWDMGEDGQWHNTASWKAHCGSVWKVTWGHPEFGQVLATCSFDRTAIVWEELVTDETNRDKSQWLKRTTLVDSRTSVTDIKFAPKHLGLQLAICSTDGSIRIYEAPDVMNLSQWSLLHEISCKISCSCMSWNPSRVHPPMIAVGSDDTTNAAGPKVLIYEFNENSRRWVKSETIPSVFDPVNDIAFAPNLGRSYHLLSVATKELRIFSIKQQRDLNAALQTTLPKLEIKGVAKLEEHSTQVWRVCWNITGTILASSGDDGTVKLWKANYRGVWKCISTLKGDPKLDKSLA
ncbi:SEH1L [Cordylochernes scorpioides]|uniref:SEH1L n=1 Tax=Cordylochernes scorpioides TaxID=51811 RepID=A0ABY6LN30_9ARAC|nr:SEH1L [Cordylochernes scorpioides]